MKDWKRRRQNLRVTTVCVGQNRLGKGSVIGTYCGMWHVLEDGGNTVRYVLLRTDCTCWPSSTPTVTRTGGPGFNSLPADRLVYPVEFERGAGI